MKVLKFKISGDEESLNLEICNSDRLFGLVCSALSAMHVNVLKPFVVMYDNECYDWHYAIMRTRLSEWNFSKLKRLEIVIDAKRYILKYLGCDYVNNEKVFNYPRIYSEFDNFLNSGGCLYFRTVYWDLKFSYTKMLEKHQNKMLMK